MAHYWVVHIQIVLLCLTATTITGQQSAGCHTGDYVAKPLSRFKRERDQRIKECENWDVKLSFFHKQMQAIHGYY